MIPSPCTKFWYTVIFYREPEKKEGRAMPITCTGDRERLIFSIMGEVDHHGAKGLMEQMDVKLESIPARRVVLDLSGVTFMDSSGIAVLLRAHRRAGETGSTVTVRGTPDQAMKVLRAAGLTRLMKFE